MLEHPQSVVWMTYGATAIFYRLRFLGRDGAVVPLFGDSPTPGVVTAECFLDVFFPVELEILGMMGSYQVVTHKFKVGL